MLAQVPVVLTVIVTPMAHSGIAQAFRSTVATAKTNCGKMLERMLIDILAQSAKIPFQMIYIIMCGRIEP